MFDLKQESDGRVRLVSRQSEAVFLEIGRGETDADIGYIGLPNASGTLCYIYPNSGGNGITVSTVKP